MLPADDGSRAGEVWRGHRGALKERPAGSTITVGHRYRTEHIYSRGDDIGLDPEINIRRAGAAKAGHEICVSRLEIRLTGADRGRGAIRAQQRRAVGLTQ